MGKFMIQKSLTEVSLMEINLRSGEYDGDKFDRAESH
jgi:hypothetical protein